MKERWRLTRSLLCMTAGMVIVRLMVFAYDRNDSHLAGAVLAFLALSVVALPICVAIDKRKWRRAAEGK